MRAYGFKDKVYDAVDCIVEHGVVAFSGTEDADKVFIEKVKKCLEPYSEIEVDVDFIKFEQPNTHGYLYYLYDKNRFERQCDELIKILIVIS
ncbi:conserved hypothetical protein [Vibrio chagasii]|nr:conserved hypothetical protein [Vibrio chagasii]CAH7017439.1 conserved hypothetical protein [Vibrio chagasii]